MARWAGNRTQARGFRVREGDRDMGPTGIPFKELRLSRDIGIGLEETDSYCSRSSSGSSARNKTSANMELLRSHLTVSAFATSIEILCLSTFALNHASNWFRPFSTSSTLRCRASRWSPPSIRIPSQGFLISNCLLILLIPSNTSSSENPVPGPPPTSIGISPRYICLIAIPNACGGIAEVSFHDVAAGVAASFFEKYGDLDVRMNLCRRKTSLGVETVISEHLGVSRNSKEVICAANGCKGSVDFE